MAMEILPYLSMTIDSVNMFYLEFQFYLGLCLCRLAKRPFGYDMLSKVVVTRLCKQHEL